MKEIKLTRGQVAVVDDEDYAWLSQYKWRAMWNPKTRSFYAIRDRRAGTKRSSSLMHREILKLTNRSIIGDHRNHDTLDNRRRNLRAATTNQSMMNQRLKKSNKSGFKGVHWDKLTCSWRARIRFNGKDIFLGYFDDPSRAGAAYEEAAHKYHGEFALSE